ncbi:hypothetical protein [Parafrankia discariae]|uniref:hypothetical protein n=1 Tax=Parafrankia discariae TaxID=365528 RepID=UPI00036452DF|nr:hypothetical protein [Parafrankia discariae]
MSSGRRYYGIAEIAGSLGVDRQLVTVWRRRLSRGMPPPDDELAAGPLWRAASIEPWIEHVRAELARSRSDAGPPPPTLIRQAARRLLRLTAVLLEDAPDASQLERALRAFGQIGDPLGGHSGEGDPLRRLCGELATLADRTRAAALSIKAGRPAGVEESPAVLAALRAECIRLLPGLAKALGSASVDR